MVSLAAVRAGLECRSRARVAVGIAALVAARTVVVRVAGALALQAGSALAAAVLLAQAEVTCENELRHSACKLVLYGSCRTHGIHSNGPPCQTGGRRPCKRPWRR